MKNIPSKEVLGFVESAMLVIALIILSGCLSIPLDQESLVKTDNSPSLTSTSSPSPLITKTPTDTPSPVFTVSLAQDPSFTNSPTPATSQTSTRYPDGYVLFEEDFENRVEELELEGGLSAWQMQDDGNGNQYLCNRNRSQTSLQIRIGDDDWANYRLEFEVKDIEFTYDPELSLYTAPEILALQVREKGDITYHFLVYFVSYQYATDTFTTKASYIYFGKSLLPKEFIPILRNDLEEPVENQWIQVSITVNEDEISFYWNDKLVINYQDEEFLSEGSISFYTNYGTCLDNIRVTNIVNTDP